MNKIQPTWTSLIDIKLNMAGFEWNRGLYSVMNYSNRKQCETSQIYFPVDAKQ